MKVLITGITGFVGLNLKQYLEEKLIEVEGIFMRNYSWNYSTSEADVIIHLAGKAHDLKKKSEPEDYYYSNFELTKKIYDDFLISNVKTFIFISSVKAVADSLNEVLTEDYIPNPKTDYGKSKLLAEQYILNNLKKGKRVFILRPCMIHGRGNKGNLTLLFKLIKNNIPFPLGAFDNRRSFLSIENLCFIIFELIQNQKIPNGIFNVSDDKAISTLAVVRLIYEQLNKRILIFRVNKRIIKSIAFLGDIFSVSFNSENLKKLTENYEVSNKKIKSVIMKELPLSTIDGLKKTLNEF